MKNLIIFAALLFSFCVTQAQDEYNQPKKQEEETQIRTTKDSITIINKEEKKNTDKSFEGISSFRRNLRIGGGLDLSSYTDPFYGQLAYLGISPQITFILSDYFEGGLTTSYHYLGSFGNVSVHSFSAGPILRAYPFESFFIQAEGVGFYTTKSIKGFDAYNKTSFNAFIGAGYLMRLSQTSYALSGIKINLISNELTNNQYLPTPFVSIHFGLWQ